MHKNIFLFTSSFILLALLSISSLLNLKIDNTILYVFIFIFIFIISYILKNMQKDFSISKFDMGWINVVKYTFFFLYIIIAYKFFEYNVISEIIFWYTLFCILFLVDSRLSFFIAFIFLSFTPMYLIIWNTAKAEILSIYAYYFLVIWVILSIVESIFDKKEQNLKIN